MEHLRERQGKPHRTQHEGILKEQQPLINILKEIKKNGFKKQEQDGITEKKR